MLARFVLLQLETDFLSQVEPASPLYNDSSDSIRNSLFAKRTRFVSESSTGSNDASEAARFQVRAGGSRL